MHVITSFQTKGRLLVTMSKLLFESSRSGHTYEIDDTQWSQIVDNIQFGGGHPDNKFRCKTLTNLIEWLEWLESIPSQKGKVKIKRLLRI